MSGDDPKKLFPVTYEKVFLVTKVGIKGGASDICPVDNVLDRYRIVMFLDDKLQKRRSQRSNRLQLSPIGPLDIH